MAEANYNQLLQVFNNAGRLIKNPATLYPTARTAGGRYSFGGTELGYVEKVSLLWEDISYPITQDWQGQTVIDEINLGENCFFVATLKGADPDGEQAVLPNHYTLDADGRHVITGPGASVAGKFRSDGKYALLFAPDDILHHRCVYFANTIPRRIDGITSMTFDIEPYGLVAMWRAVPNSDGNSPYTIFWTREP